VATKKASRKPERRKATREKPVRRTKEKPARARGSKKRVASEGTHKVWTYDQFKRLTAQELLAELKDWRIFVRELTRTRYGVECYANGTIWVVAGPLRELSLVWARLTALKLLSVFTYPGPYDSGTQGTDDPPPDPREPTG
jgi:hypothetical protein